MGRGEYLASQEHGLPAEGSNAIATLGPRLVAYVLDLAVLALVALTDGHATAAGVALQVANLVVLPTRWGTTLGHAAARLRIVPLVDGEVLLDQRGLTLTTALGRALEWVCCWPVTPVLLFVAGADGRTVVDRWTDTVVVEW